MTEWKEYKLGDVCSRLSSGKGIKSDFITTQGKYPVWGGNGVRGFTNTSNFSGRCCIIGRQGAYCGNVHFFEGDAYMTEHAVVAVGNELADSYFLACQLSLMHLENLSAQSAQPGISVKTLSNQIVSLPPLPTQRRIASILSSLDDKIDLLHRENATLEQMTETLFKELVLNKENEGTLEQIISIQNGYAFKSKDFKDVGTHKVIKIKNISDSIVNIDTTDFIDDNAIMGLSPKFKIYGGDILIAMTGAEIGKLGIIPQNDKSLWLNQRVGLLVEKLKGSKYLAYLQLKSDFGQDYIENTATGSAQPNISGIGIEKCGFPIFKQENLIQISLQIGELYDKIIFNLGQINLLKDTRDFLLPKLISNEIKLI